MPGFDPQVSRFASLFARAAHAAAAFEQDWLAGKSPQLENYLPDDDSDTAELAFLELLRIEIRLRRAEGREASRDVLAERFTPYQSLIAEYFDASDEYQITTKVANGSTIAGTNQSGNTSSPDELTFIAGYRILEQIGEGGMGIVYRAIQPGANRVVALKIIRPAFLSAHRSNLKKEVIYRFLQEARATAKLTHENIVTVYEVGEIDEEFFLSMQYLAGDNLAKKLREGPIPPIEAAQILEQVCRGLHHAHHQGVIHRDIKPSNILFNEHGKPLISDFGLAKLADESALPTPTGLVLGTPAYMPPEQFSSPKEIGPRSDVYSVGATLYQMLTGRPPFAAAEPLEVLRQVAEMNPVPPRKLNPSIPRDLETITLKCLEKLPSRRYMSAREMADDLIRFRQGKPIHARSVSAAERAWSWGTRNPTLSATGIGVAVLAFLLVTTTTWYLTRVDSLSRIAETHKFISSILTIGSRRTEKPNGWTFKNKEDIAKIARFPSTPEERARLRDEHISTLVEFDLRALGPLGPKFDHFGMCWSHAGDTLVVGANITHKADKGFEELEVFVYGGSPRVYRDRIAIPIANDVGDEGVRSLAFSSDDARLFIGTRRGWVICVELETKRVVASFKAHLEKVLCIALDERERWLLTTASDETYKIWDTTDWSAIGEGDLKGRSGRLTGGFWLPDRLVLAAGAPLILPLPSSRDVIAAAPEYPAGTSYFLPFKNRPTFIAVDEKKAFLVDLYSGRVETKPLHRMQSSSQNIHGVAISQDENYVAIASEDLVTIISAKNLEILGQFPVSGDGNRQVAFDPKESCLWLTRADQVHRYELNSSRVWRMTCSQWSPNYNGNGMLPQAHFRPKIEWGSFVLEPLYDANSPISYARVAWGSRFSRYSDLATAYDKGSILNWSQDIHRVAQEKMLAAELNVRGESFPIRRIPAVAITTFAMSPTGKEFCLGFNGEIQETKCGMFRIESMSSQKEIGTSNNLASEKDIRKSSYIDTLCGAHFAAVLSTNQTVRSFNLATGTESTATPLGPVSPTCLAGNPDEPRIFVGTKGGEVLEVRAASISANNKLPVVTLLLSSKTCVSEIAYSRNGLLAVGYQLGDVELWDVRGKEAIRVCELIKLPQAVDYMEFSASGDELTIHSPGDHFARVLHVAQLFAELDRVHLNENTWEDFARSVPAAPNPSVRRIELTPEAIPYSPESGRLIGRLSSVINHHNLDSESHKFTLVLGPGAVDNKRFSIDDNRLIAMTEFRATDKRPLSIRVRATCFDGDFFESVIEIPVASAERRVNGRFQLIDLDRSGTPSANEMLTGTVSINADGEYLAFSSTSPNLVLGDTNQIEDVFVRKVKTGEIWRASTCSIGNNANGPSYNPVISADGLTVAFYSFSKNLVHGDINDAADVFLKNLKTGEIQCVSTNADGTHGNHHSENPSISTDGRYIAFASLASNLVPEDTDSYMDVFVKDMHTGNIQLASKSVLGPKGNSHTQNNASISADGRIVVFASHADNLVANDDNQCSDIFIKNLESGAIKIASESELNLRANAPSVTPRICADGTHVLFSSSASNLVLPNTNGELSTFVKDLKTGQVVLVSKSASNDEGNGPSVGAQLSVNGRFVVFSSLASNLVKRDRNGSYDAFIRDLWTDELKCLSINESGDPSNGESANPCISPNCKFIGFSSSSTDIFGQTKPRGKSVYRIPFPFHSSERDEPSP